MPVFGCKYTFARVQGCQKSCHTHEAHQKTDHMHTNTIWLLRCRMHQKDWLHYACLIGSCFLHIGMVANELPTRHGKFIHTCGRCRIQQNQDLHIRKENTQTDASAMSREISGCTGMSWRRSRLAHKMCILTLILITVSVALVIVLETLCGQRAGMMMTCEYFSSVKNWHRVFRLCRLPFRIFFDGTFLSF